MHIKRNFPAAAVVLIGCLSLLAGSAPAATINVTYSQALVFTPSILTINI